MTETGRCRLIFNFPKAIAESFRRWIFHLLISSIRKTGNYLLQNAQFERMKLECELIKAKQHYRNSGYAIRLSTSAATLQWLRADASSPKEIKYIDRFADRRGKEIGSKKGRSAYFLNLRDHSLQGKFTP